MKLDIYTGKRVLYKHDGQWEVGVLSKRNPEITSRGLYLFIVPKDFMELKDEDTPFVHDAEINDIFLNAEPLGNWKYYDECYMTKEAYCDLIESERFEKQYEQAWVADDEYFYYPISMFSRKWIMRQPFTHIVRKV